MTRRRKTALVVVVVVLGVGGFAWYWQATAVDRQVHALLDEVRRDEPGGIQGWLIELGLTRDRRTLRGYWEVAGDLSKLGPSAAPALIRALRDKDVRVRCSAVVALGNLRDARAVAPLIAGLKDGSPFVRYYAADALGKSEDARGVERLIAALKDEDRNVRERAAWALGELGDRRGVEPLIAALKDEHAGGKGSVAWALGELEDARAIEPLEELLIHGDVYVRKTAKAALERLRPKREDRP